MKKQIKFYDELIKQLNMYRTGFDDQLYINVRCLERIERLEAENKQLKKELEDLKTDKQTRPPHLKVVSINKFVNNL